MASCAGPWHAVAQQATTAKCKFVNDALLKRFIEQQPDSYELFAEVEYLLKSTQKRPGDMDDKADALALVKASSGNHGRST